MNWIRINTLEDLPDETCDVFFIPTHHNRVVLGHFYLGPYGDFYFGDGQHVIDAGQVSHYQKIIEPDMPQE